MLNWCVAIATSALATIVASERGWRRGVYVFKPLTTLLILALTVAQPAGDHRYVAFIAAGLVFSLAGDVLLMLPRDRFVAGLVAFLVAHLLYIRAFTLGRFGMAWWLVIPLVIYGAMLLRFLLPHVPRELRGPVIGYAMVLLAMAWTAGARWMAGVPGGALAATGGVLFVASDSALAINRFARRLRRGDAVVLATYYAAQTLIALSIR